MSIAHGQRWSVLNENSIPDQTAADSANQREHEQTYPVIMPADSQQRAGHGVEERRAQVDIKRERK